MPQPPKEQPKRRNPRIGPVALPAEGRKGRPPAWPLPGRKLAGEEEAWRELWRTPQAVAWEQLGWTRVVARYCRIMVFAESGGVGAKDAWAEARQLEDRLGLTPKAMRLLLWSIVEDETAERREERSKPAAKRRLRAVDAASS